MMYSTYAYRHKLVRPLKLSKTEHLEREGIVVVEHSETVRAFDFCPLPGFSRETYDDVRTTILGDGFVAACNRFGTPPALTLQAPPVTVRSAHLIFDDAKVLLGPDDVVKIKVGRESFASDKERVARIVEHCRRAHARLRIDANHALDVESVYALYSISSDVLEFFEEPVSLNDLSRLDREIPVALDESFMSADVTEEALLRAVAYVVKPSILLDDTTRVIAQARRHQKPVIVSSAFESAVGHAALLQLCQRLSDDERLPKAQRDVVHGLSTDVYFEALTDPLVVPRAKRRGSLLSFPSNAPTLDERVSLKELLSKRVLDAAMIIEVQGDGTEKSLSTRDVLAFLEAHATDRTKQRVAVVGHITVSSILELLQILYDDATAVLIHPRWPQTMVDAACAVVGVGSTDDVGDIATIAFSSGSTGTPKAFAHPLKAHVASARNSNAHIPFAEGDRWLLSLSPSHVGGLAILFRALISEGAVVVVADRLLPIEVQIEMSRATHVSCVSSQLMRMISGPDDEVKHRLRHVKEMLLGGGAFADALITRAMALGVPVRQTWGMTEAASQVCTSTKEHPFACGRALPHSEVAIDADGVLHMHSESLATAQIFDGGQQRRALTDDSGFYATGDVAHFDEQRAGFVIEGRSDLRFKCGGENVFPEAIEMMLADERASIVVVPVAHALWQHAPFAFVDAAGAPFAETVARLEDRARANLPVFMRPISYAPLELSTGMKPSRRALIEKAERIWSESLRNPKTEPH